MDEQGHKPYSHRRWTDIPKAVTTGHFKMTPEEEEKYDRDFTKILREYKQIGEDEEIRNGKVVKARKDGAQDG